MARRIGLTDRKCRDCRLPWETTSFKSLRSPNRSLLASSTILSSSPHDVRGLYRLPSTTEMVLSLATFKFALLYPGSRSPWRMGANRLVRGTVQFWTPSPKGPTVLLPFVFGLSSATRSQMSARWHLSSTGRWEILPSIYTLLKASSLDSVCGDMIVSNPTLDFRELAAG